ncbi:MAG: Transglycosylase-like domain [Actinomycetota bacterium]
MRRSITAAAALLALAGPAIAFGASQAAGREQRASRQTVAYYGREIARFEKGTWYWQRVMGLAATAADGRELARLSSRELQLLDQRWQQRSAAAYRQAQHPPHLQALLCIHRHEATWDDPGAPYYGGLQMDLGFQRTYGGWLYRAKGTADRWTPLEQIWTAEKAVKSRGFWPWPSAARLCGLV